MIGMQPIPSTPAALGAAVRDLRHAIGWTQAELGRRAAVSQSTVSLVETGRCPDLAVRVITELLGAMGATLHCGIEAPYLADRSLQRDAGHVRCVEYAAARLRRAGWEVAIEVEVGSDRSRGWIDILAYRPSTGLVIVFEVKTELHDLGAIERSLGWYEREAWAAARRRGWRPSAVIGALLLLGTEAVDDRVRQNRSAIMRAYPGRATELRAVVAGARPLPRRRFVAIIDPMSRRTDWLRPLWIDGRRSPAPYPDYAGFMRARVGRARAHRRRVDPPAPPRRPIA
jgi:transcriptional regulator with XRE-family HTH domain